MSPDLETTLEKEEEYQVKARYYRNKFGKCPALRGENGEYYCSRMIPCEKYALDKFVYVKKPGGEGVYTKCKFIEKND